MNHRLLWSAHLNPLSTELQGILKDLAGIVMNCTWCAYLTALQSTLSPTHLSSSLVVWYAVDLFSLHVLFSQCRSCDKTHENCFFQIFSYPRAQSMKRQDLHWENKTCKLLRCIGLLCGGLRGEGERKKIVRVRTQKAGLLVPLSPGFPRYFPLLLERLEVQ